MELDRGTTDRSLLLRSLERRLMLDAAMFPAALELSDIANGDGSEGLAIEGVDADDASGLSVHAAGDINGDGIDDIIIGASGGDGAGNASSGSGETYVVFGKNGGFGSSVDLSTLDGTNGFVVYGVEVDDLSGVSVSAAGDINGDGFDDIAIGASGGDGLGNKYSGGGDSYVVFGKNGGFSASIDLSALDGTDGFVVLGNQAGEQSGFSVSGAGDINGDGFDDLIVGAPTASTTAGKYTNVHGESYVVFGSNTFGASLYVGNLNGTNGFKIVGTDNADYSGTSVSAAGDINGDGFDDIVIGAYGADGVGNKYGAVGGTYVVFGKNTGFAATLNLNSLNGANGFIIHGVDAGDFSGMSVSNAGDVNADGFDDLIIGAPEADGNANAEDGAGDAYVLFGTNTGFAANFNLSSLNGTNGFIIHGVDAGDKAGASVSAAGDVNGDGIDDIIIGASAADGKNNNFNNSGESYVVFGKNTAFAASLNLADLDGTNGFVMYGENSGDQSGISVSSAGDINNDGIDDLIVGSSSNNSYIVYGRINDPPVIDTNMSLNVVQGASLGLTSANLETTDIDTANNELIYTITANVSDGTLFLAGSALGVSDTFTQDDVNSGLLSYVHNGNPPGTDGFNFSVTDGETILAGNTFNFNVTAITPGVPVVTTNLALELDEGATKNITVSELDTTDTNTADSGLVYKVSAVSSNGTLQLGGLTLGINDTFTQQDIISGLLSYTHNGSETTSDSFDFTVTDGTTTTAQTSFNISIEPVNDQAPMVDTNEGITVVRGQADKVISDLALEANDLDTADNNLTFRLASIPINGTLFRDGVALSVNDTFTQKDINDGLISYTHNGSQTDADSFIFTVNDGVTTLASQVFEIDVDPLSLAGDTSLPEVILHYDAQDIDGDGDIGDQPANGAAIANWGDTSLNDFDGTQSGGLQPTYDTSAFGGLGGVRFDGIQDIMNIQNDVDINTGSYAEKSFALVFETGANVGGVQIIYEQGGGGNGYNIAIVDGNLYAYVWGETYYGVGDQFKSIDLGAVEANTAYRVVAVHDATGATLDDRTFSASVNGGPMQSLSRVDVLGAHGGNVAIGGVFNQSQNPVTNADIPGNNVSLFEGAIGEFAAWNYALNATDLINLEDFLAEKWFAPQLTVGSSLSLSEGASETITSAHLSAFDLDTSEDSLIFQITTNVNNGHLELSTDPGVAVSSFTLADVEAGLLSYVHNDSNTTSDFFRFTLSDGKTTLAEQSFNISISAVFDGNLPDTDDALSEEAGGSNANNSNTNRDFLGANNDFIQTSLRFDAGSYEQDPFGLGSGILLSEAISYLDPSAFEFAYYGAPLNYVERLLNADSGFDFSADSSFELLGIDEVSQDDPAWIFYWDKLFGEDALGEGAENEENNIENKQAAAAFTKQLETANMVFDRELQAFIQAFE